MRNTSLMKNNFFQYSIQRNETASLLNFDIYFFSQKRRKKKINVRDRRQSPLLILSEFERINQILFPLFATSSQDWTKSKIQKYLEFA